VWFAGAHSDVGGGYHESGLSGVSLNWMIDNLAPTGLLPPQAAVRADPFGSSHDPEHGTLLYHAINRDVLRYALDAQTLSAFRAAVCVHPSVFERRQRLPAQPHENRQLHWAAPGPVRPVLVPNPLDYGWPWYVVQDGQPGPAEVQVQSYPDCNNMPPRLPKAPHAP